MSISRRVFIKGIAALAAASILPDISGIASPVPSVIKPEKIVPSVGEHFQKGDIVTFQGVYAVNPTTKKPTGMLRQFVIMDDQTLSVHPPINGRIFQ